MDEEQSPLDLEIELIQSSLLPAESLKVADGNVVDIKSHESKLVIHISVADDYPAVGSVAIEIKGPEVHREEAEGWKRWVEERISTWDSDDDYPLFQLLTTHFLPLLAPASPVEQNSAPAPSHDAVADVPHHALLTSHHLLSNTKRKDLIALSSSLSLVGFAKTGHPGIYYAIGTKEDLVEWIREVKSWNWLALKVRMTPEPIGDEGEMRTTRGGEEGARGGKGRGEWTELEKISEALEWLKSRGREGLLLDIGMGGGAGKP